MDIHKKLWAHKYRSNGNEISLKLTFITGEWILSSNYEWYAIPNKIYSFEWIWASGLEFLWIYNLINNKCKFEGEYRVWGFLSTVKSHMWLYELVVIF